MAIPIKYNIRHVMRRWKTTAMTVFAVGLVVAMFVCVLALANGLSQAFVVSGDPSNVLLMRKGSTAETNSTVNREDYYDAKFLPGVARGTDGEPQIAVETANIASMAKASGGSSNAVFRGVGPTSLSMRKNIRLVEGRMVTPGLNELMVGSSATTRFKNARIGDTIKLVKSEWKIVGRFDASKSAFDSEFWGDVEQLNREFDRTVYSSMLIRAESPELVPTIIQTVETDQRLASLKAQTEISYYEEQTKSSMPIQFLGMMISVIMAVGAVFAAMNAMYASVSSRSTEIATLRVLGFSRRSILLSFSIESLVIGMLGGIVGGILAMPINGVSTGTANFVTFSEVAFAFRVTPGLIASGIIFASLIGVVGGFLPALQASRLPIIDGLKGGG
jgi:putative ABC transport system permease protein